MRSLTARFLPSFAGRRTIDAHTLLRLRKADREQLTVGAVGVIWATISRSTDIDQYWQTHGIEQRAAFCC